VTHHYRYMEIILIPGIPAVFITWLIGRKALRKRAKVVAISVLLLTIYCVLIDLVAIRLMGIWSFSASTTVKMRFLGDYVEEWVLFLVTQSLVVMWGFIVREYFEKRASISNKDEVNSAAYSWPRN